MGPSFHCDKRCSDKDDSLGLPEEVIPLEIIEQILTRNVGDVWDFGLLLWWS